MKLDAPWQALPGLDDLLRALGPGGDTIRFVGGCVRDAIVGRPVNDIDCATRLLPDEVMEKARAAGFSVVPTGLKHGTVTVILPGGEPIEVTTLRRDVDTDGRHATVEFTTSWETDAGRRDFTINALSADPFTGEVYDYFGGLKDLRAGRVRFIGDALARIDEDRLRVLRFFRFHQRYGAGYPDAAGLAACRERATQLDQLSAERIASELLKILVAPKAADTFCTMIEQNILCAILPEASGPLRLKLLEEREQYLGLAPDGIRRLSTIFFGGAEAAEAIGRRLKLSTADRERLVALKAGSWRPEDAQESTLPSLEAMRRHAYRDGADIVTDRAIASPMVTPQALRMIVEALQNWERPALPIKGGELIEMGLTAGPIVSHCMRQIEDEWIGANFPDRHEVVKIAQRVIATARAPA